MTENIYILYSLITVMVIAIIVEIIQSRYNAVVKVRRIQQSFDTLEATTKQAAQTIRDEISATAAAGKQAHAEQIQALRDLRENLEQRLQRLQDETAAKVEQARQDAFTNTKSQREETAKALQAIASKLNEVGQVQQTQAESVVARLDKLAGTTDQKLTGLQTAVDAKLKASQDDCSRQLEQLRAAVDQQVQAAADRLNTSVQQVGTRVEQVRQGLSALTPKS